MDTRGLDPESLNYPASFDDFVIGDRNEPALLYRISDAASLLGISRSNVYHLLNEGRLTSVRIGSRRLIPRAALESFVECLPEAS
jgi:excisionase family DNA binding protein